MNQENETASGHQNGPSRRVFATAVAASATVASTTALGGTAFAAPAAPAAPTAPHLPGPAKAPDPARSRAVARAVMVLDDQDKPLTPQYLKVLGEGLPRTGTASAKVIVVGAGPAGMLAAYLLKKAGHRVTVLEANGNRAGGRVKTFRSGGHEGAEQPFEDPRQYAEAGAMRLPDSHPLLMKLIEQLGIKKDPFKLVAEDAEGHRTNRTWLVVNGVRMRRADYEDHPEAVNRSFGVPDKYLGMPASKILESVLDPIRDYYSVKDSHGVRKDKPVAEAVQGWTSVIQEFGDYSMFRFLTEHAKLDERTVDLIGTLENVTSRLPLAFLHSFMDASLISPDTKFYELHGGTAMLADGMIKRVKGDVRFDRRVTRIEYRDPQRPDAPNATRAAKEPAVWMETVSEGRNGKVEREQFTADLAVITVPFSGLRQVQFHPTPSYPKRRALVELHYDAATKVLLEFSRRWWEFTEEDWKNELAKIEKFPGLYDTYRKGKAPDDGSLLGAHPSVSGKHITEGQRVHYAANRWLTRDQPEAANVYGGGSVSDNTNRFMFNPSTPVEGSAGGVVLASYSWADDAVRWDAFDEEARYPYALRGLQEVYGQRIEVFYTGVGKTQSWLRDPYAYGEASVLLPGQHTELFPDIPKPEGPLHFAGDHTSLKPAWIEGALESGVRAALEVHAAARTTAS